MGRILVIDDEVKITRLLQIQLEEEGHRVKTATTGEEALREMGKEEFDVVITDLKMPDVDGLTILEKTKENYPSTQVILITAYATVETAVKAMKKGAFDYITKPLNLEEVGEIVNKALRIKRLETENLLLREELFRESRTRIVGKSEAIKKVFRLIEKVAPERTTVLIQGETGTGKELVARAIHMLSPRRKRPYVVVNCAAIPENLLESELFGHSKGAFTGAVKDKKGKFHLAEGGTIFLDEVSSLSLGLQAKLLRFLETREFEPLGSNTTYSVDVRVIAATNRNLAEATQEGSFREDLYYRLNVFPIYLPPLRERKEDIPVLVEHFIKIYSQEMGKEIKGLTQTALKKLMNYHWPGNVRELENLVERAIVLSDSPYLDDRVFSIPEEREVSLSLSSYQEAKRKTLEEFDRRFIVEVLKKTRGNILKACRQIGMDRKNFYLKLRKLNIDPRSFR